MNEFVFANCSSLQSVIVPPNVKTIGESAFQRCINLVNVSLPASLNTIGDSVFAECNNLSKVIFNGTQNPVCSDDTFSACGLLDVICVPEDYDSSSFCGYDSLCKSISCEELTGVNNQCYEVVSCTVVQQRKNATDWENRPSGCVHYYCDNESGAMSRSNCDRDEICIDDRCVRKEEIDNSTYSVVIDMSNVSDAGSLNVTELLEDISAIDEDEMVIGIELDDDGQIVNIIIFVQDEETANNIADTLNNCSSNESSYSSLKDDYLT